MKEKIYTIPVNEAYDKDCECPLCELEKSLESEAVKYSLGAAMMEPDYRTESNEKGYCRRHFKMMFDSPNKLPLALILDTHLGELRKKLAEFEKDADALEKHRGGLFRKSGADKTAAEISASLSAVEHECMICQKTERTMERYIDVLVYMWENDDAFRAKFERSKGVCLRHFKQLADYCAKNTKYSAFLASLIRKELVELARMQSDIHKFTLKFDYRNADMEWGTAEDAPIRTIEKIAGYIVNDFKE